MADITRDQRLATPSPNHWKNQHMPKQDAAVIPINPKTPFLIRRSGAIAQACGLASGDDYVVPAPARQRIGRDLLRERPRGRHGTWQTDRGARHSLRSGIGARAIVQSVRVGADDKPAFEPVAEWRDRETADRFSAAVVEMVRAAHPDAFTARAT